MKLERLTKSSNVDDRNNGLWNPMKYLKSENQQKGNTRIVINIKCEQVNTKLREIYMCCVCKRENHQINQRIPV